MRYIRFKGVKTLTLALFRIHSRYFAFIRVISHLTFAFLSLFALFCIRLSRFSPLFAPLLALFRLYSHYNAFQFRVISLLFAFLRLSFALISLWCNMFFRVTLIGFRTEGYSKLIFFFCNSFMKSQFNL